MITMSKINRWIQWIGFLGCIVLMSACKQAQKTQPQGNYSTMTVSTTDKELTTAYSATIRGRQDIDIYVINAEGAYLHVPQSNSLRPIAKGDYRKAVAGGQDFVQTAPVSLVLVSDLSRFGDVSDRTRLMAAVDAGIVCQNINLFCAAAGLATVPRATMDQAALKKLLKLTDSQLPLMNNPVGYPKK